MIIVRVAICRYRESPFPTEVSIASPRVKRAAKEYEREYVKV